MWQPYDLSAEYKLNLEARHEKKTRPDPPKWAQPEMSASDAQPNSRRRKFHVARTTQTVLVSTEIVSEPIARPKATTYPFTSCRHVHAISQLIGRSNATQHKFCHEGLLKLSGRLSHPTASIKRLASRQSSA